MKIKKSGKETQKYISFRGYLVWSTKLFALILLLNSCREDAVLWNVDSTQQVITEYIENNPDYSEFYGLMESTGMNSLLSVRGPFTVFLPANEQMQAYYTEKGVNSYSDFSAEFQEQLILYHIIPSHIETGDIGLGAIREVNGIGDYLVSEFEGSDIIINKNSKIIKRDILASNGVIQLVDKVLDPVTKSIYDVLADDPSYSIFTQGLDLTGLKDTLQVISFPYGTRTARSRFTILAIADTTFNRFGIYTVDDLISEFTDSPDSITYLENGFYRYMEYHCLAETYYLSDLVTTLYPILSYDNNVFITVDSDYKINLTKDGVYTGFIIDQSNIPGKNGTIHSLYGLLPVYEPSPTIIDWEVTDQFDMKQGDYYMNSYARFYDGENTFATIKWEGDYLLYYYKENTIGWNRGGDCLSMSGWWWVEVITPKIMKGKYTISGNIWSGDDKADYAVYIDGVNTAYIKRSDPAITTPWAEVEWTKTENHKVKVVAKDPGLLFWDTVVFTPSR